MKPTTKQAALVLAIFLLGWGGHILYSRLEPSASAQAVQVREDSSEYHFINPLLYVDNSQSTFPALNPLKEDFETFIDKEKLDEKADQISVYYRDLNSASWTGVGEDQEYVPGSILKVATLMTYLKIGEDDSNVLNEMIPYHKDPTDHQNYPPQEELADGSYKASKLLGQAIIESDNAANLGLASAHEPELAKLYKSLRLPLPSAGLKKDFMSPRQVSVIFRALYSSTYLLDSYSEQALELLSRTTFTQGLVAGVPAGTIVSHKFGEHTIYYPDGKAPDYQLHDCGIVYYPKKPYLICVMTKGKSLPNLEEALSTLSQLAYTFVAKH